MTSCSLYSLKHHKFLNILSSFSDYFIHKTVTANRHIMERGKVKHELWVASYKFRYTSYEFKPMSYEFESKRYEFKPTCYEFQSASYENQSTSYEFQSTSYEFKSTNYGWIWSWFPHLGPLAINWDLMVFLECLIVVVFFLLRRNRLWKGKLCFLNIVMTK